MGRQHSLQMASRVMTELTSKASRAGVGSSLRRLSDGGYLRVVKRSTFSTGNVYGKGRILDSSSESGRGIARLAETWFGKEGLCRHLLGLPAFGHGYLSHSGMLLVGVLACAKGPIAASALRRYLAPIMVAQTTDRAINRLFDWGLISDRKQIALVGDWRKRLDRDPDGNLLERAVRTRARHAKERDSFRLSRGFPTAADRAKLLEFPCVVCGLPSKEIDHFPPQVFLRTAGLVGRKSRLRAHFSFLHPICTSCHDEHDAWIAEHADDQLPEVETMPSCWSPDAGLADLKRVLTETLTRRAKVYYRALETDRTDVALRAIAHALVMWRQLIADDSGLAEPSGVVVVEPKRRIRGGAGATARRSRRRARYR